MNDFPLRHLSVRVPWHDNGWTGTICKVPERNNSCTQLVRIAGKKRDDLEQEIAGLSLDIIPDVNSWPPCVDERATFMAPFEMTHTKSHALSAKDKEHYGHFLPTQQRYPAYSAGVVPFAWMMRSNLSYFAEHYGLDVDESREPDLGYSSNWVHEATNQRNLLNGFAGHFQSDQSLSFFYAKHVPFLEGTGRIIVGIGKVKSIGLIDEYKRDGEGQAGMVWERPIQHSIRPKGGEGFIFPFEALLEEVEKDSSLDIERYIARAPDEHWNEFSYASELVTHDGAISALLSVDRALLRIENELAIPTWKQREWLQQELIRLWQVRGPYPGLGAVLTAFGLSRGVFVAHVVQEQSGENADPWPLVDEWFSSPERLPEALRKDIKELRKVWRALPEERRTFLQLLSRFELSAEQAKHLYDKDRRQKLGLTVTDQEIIADPYCLYTGSRLDPEGISLLAIDRGIFPEDIIRNKHPLPAPSELESALDIRRVRAFSIAALEAAASDGHSLLSISSLLTWVQDFAVQPACNITSDILTAYTRDMAPEVVPVDLADGQGLRLARYEAISKLVKQQVLGRVKGKRHNLAVDWRAVLDKKFGHIYVDDPDEEQARIEKAAALGELAKSRFSILAGPAGAGKTTVLGLLCAQPSILDSGILMLAPTGKARVRMQELVHNQGITALTIAQFLMRNGRYSGRTGRYYTSNKPRNNEYRTVIIDESSMLTEDMIGALFDAMQGVERFIFVGDPSQLPPIGAGRPFVDIVNKFKPENNDSLFPRIARGYAELTIERRQGGSNRPDLCFARWFSNAPPDAWDDDIFSSKDNVTNLRFVRWDKSEEFHEKLLSVAVEELELESVDDVRGFNASLGGIASGDYDYFNAGRNDSLGSVKAVDKWQILSPLKGMAFGCQDINYHIHEQFRQSFMKLASFPRYRKIPRPMGAERIVYGDKVINLENTSRVEKRVWPKEGGINYLANGEVGLAVGQWKTKKMKKAPAILKVEFTSQPGFTYDFNASHFKEEGEAKLELAYALTVHKAQGSQFETVILVLPEGHPILSRELIYTALTRHQKRVVIMHQGPRSLLRDFSMPHKSSVAQRQTSLLDVCDMQELPQPRGSLFMQKGLAHLSADGIAMRSKSELLIYNALIAAGQRPEYEKPLEFGHSVRYPDFTIEDEISGQKIYWEHLGLLERDDYRQKWEKKLQWYRENGILTYEEGGGEEGVLVTSTESSVDGLNMQLIQQTITQLFY